MDFSCQVTLMYGLLGIEFVQSRISNMLAETCDEASERLAIVYCKGWELESKTLVSHRASR